MNEFKEWMNEENISLAAFSAKTGIPYHTVEKWYFMGARPRTTTKLVIANHYPKCPLLNQ